MHPSSEKENKLLGFLGMRVVKTSLAVYICFLISMYGNRSPFYSTIAAIISMKSDTGESLNAGKNRIIGTIIGGLFGLGTILIINYFDVELFSHFHYLILSILIIPLIYTTVNLYSSASTSISCVVFLSIAVSHVEDISPFMFALNRTLQTAIGVIVSVLVNNLL